MSDPKDELLILSVDGMPEMTVDAAVIGPYIDSIVEAAIATAGDVGATWDAVRAVLADVDPGLREVVATFAIGQIAAAAFSDRFRDNPDLHRPPTTP